MASTSSGGKTPLLVREASSNFRPYPQLDGKYEDVAADPKLFMDNLKKLHASMGTKFMIPIIGGKELDLHRLFREVTSRGGIGKILRDKKWKEVTSLFNFPSTATNASFVLRKYYHSLLRHFEQIYYFKSHGYSVSGDNLHSPSRTSVSPMSSPPENQAAKFQHSQISDAEMSGAKTPPSSAGTSVIGVIDGKFESGYLVTVTIGSKKLKGVLYQCTQDPSWQTPRGTYQQTPSSNRNDNANASSAVPGVHRRRRRKKSEIKRRDPAHPKPNRSGYNFFFKEQHARLKPLHPGKDRDISRMIGELWNKLNESERAVYQEKAVKDKERYRIEMEGYRERLRTGHEVISDAVPLQQRFPEPDISMAESEDRKIEETEGGDSPTLDNESDSGKSDSDDDGIAEKDSADEEESQEAVLGAHSGLVGMETEEGLHEEKLENVGDEGIERTAEEREVNPESKETKEEEEELKT
ncbi:High mobility group B protein 15 [Morus notabilis]|uniref:High mobility group B protein 15 n=1 Tax=Morus notabilis TaxID=981085 RepID=W9RXY4_9ROSA|nr:high mobility group B protein 15 [Morus notabilis]XP_024028874.1 high mobility group B protein 15 [Morus notabilis]EXC16957.1 High mobility group B protein 15 [Morus notabilis]